MLTQLCRALITAHFKGSGAHLAPGQTQAVLAVWHAAAAQLRKHENRKGPCFEGIAVAGGTYDAKIHHGITSWCHLLPAGRAKDQG